MDFDPLTSIMDTFTGTVGDSGVNMVDRLAEYFRTQHRDRFMIWNLSEQTYDYGKFNNEVIDVNFPGYPAPPLHTLCTLCDGIDAWLRADELNVAVVHCSNGTGRTGAVIACYLAWTRQFESTNAALEHIATVKGTSIDEIVNPTQLRYCNYFNNLLKNQLPSGRPIFLKRVIMNTIPSFGPQGICRPYLQIFKNAKMVFSSTWSAKTIKSYTPEDGSIIFPVDSFLDDDILVRIRHLSANGDRISMLRFGFHTGYIKQGDVNFRLLKNELDGACVDSRFADDFLVDLICSTPEADASSSMDQEFWKNMASRKISEEDALKITPMKHREKQVNHAILAEDDDDLHQFVSDSNVLDSISNTFTKSLRETGASFTTLLNSFATPLTPMPAVRESEENEKKEVQNYDDLEKYIQDLGHVEEVNPKASLLAIAESPDIAALPHPKTLPLKNIELSPANIKAPILDTGNLRETSVDKNLNIASKSSISLDDLDDSTFLESVLNQLGGDESGDDEPLNLEDIENQLDDDEDISSAKNGHSSTVTFADLP